MDEPELNTITAEEIPAETPIAQTGETQEAVAPAPPEDDPQVKAAIEAIVYVTEEPATAAQIANALKLPEDRIKRLIDELVEEYNAPGHGVAIREIAGGYKVATKPEYHETVRTFVKSLKPPLKLSLAALETLATIAYKQPITGPEIMEIRGVQGAGVLKTLLDRKLIQTSGRKNVVGRPILYKTSKDFLVQFGLKDLSELPTLKEFEELRRLAVSDAETAAEEAPAESSDAEVPEPVAEALPNPEAATQVADTEAQAAAPAEQMEEAAGAPIEAAETQPDAETPQPEQDPHPADAAAPDTPAVEPQNENG